METPISWLTDRTRFCGQMRRERDSPRKPEAGLKYGTHPAWTSVTGGSDPDNLENIG
ncbi:hypothetical protein J6590_001092 [Homalodisca vitripennis]|nr:hypothetical protein J6590_001092 [Homalodisca vitripennis]